MLPWDLDPSLTAFPRTPAEGDLLVLETRAKVSALPWHRQKLTLVVSALRHFVEERRAAGFHVEHHVADDYAEGIGFTRSCESAWGCSWRGTESPKAASGASTQRTGSTPGA